MRTSTFYVSATSWHQGQCTGWETYNTSSGFISSDPISIDLATQYISFSGTDPQCVMLKKCNIDGETQSKTFDDPYLSTETPITYKLFDKDHTQLTSGSIVRGGSANVSSYPTARYIVITIEAASNGSYYNYSIRPDEDSCVATGNRCVAQTIEFGYGYYLWEFYSDGFPRYEEATIYPVDYPQPFPDIHWKVNAQHNDGFVYHDLLPEVTEYGDIPDIHWRVDPYHNNGFVYHPLLPNVPYDPPPPPEDEPTTLLYDIYCDDKLLHSSLCPDIGYKVVNATLDLQDSAAGSLEFSLPVSNNLYGEMLMMRSTLKVYRNGEEIFECRPVSFKEDMWKNHNVVCEGELAYLNDIFQVQAKYENVTLEQFLYAVIGVTNGNIDASKGYNQRCAESRRFNVGTVPTPETAEATDLLTIVVPFESTLSTINSVCSKYKLHVAVNKRLNENSGEIERYLDFYSEEGGLGENSTQSIMFGENLIDYAKSYNFAETVTAVLPLGAKSNSAGKVVADDAATLTPASTYSGYVIWPSNSKDSAGNYHAAGSLVDISSIDDYSRDSNYTVYSYAITEEDATVFITAQQKMGAGMVIVNNGANKYYLKSAKKSDAFTTWTKSKTSTWYTSYDTTQPTTLCVGTYGAPPTVYKSKTVDSGLEDYVTVESVNNGDLWVTNESTMNIYGRIEKKIEFSDDKDSWTLYQDALKYLSSDQFDGLQINITALDMSVLGVKNVRRLRVGEKVRCVAPCYGLDSMMPITAMKIPLDKPEDTKYTVGYKTKQNLTSVNNSTNTELLAMIAEKPTTSAVLSAAKTEAAQFLNDTANGYVSYRYSEEGDTEAIIISDHKDYKNPPLGNTSGYWIFGKNGIGHITDYAHEEDQYTEANVAMTADGRVVADYIVAGLMLADRIRGGTLNLGHWPVGGFVLTTSEPANWSTNYQQYFYYDSDVKEYKHVDPVNGAAPTWVTETYYTTNSNTDYVEGILKIMGKTNTNPLLQFGRSSDETGKYKHGLEIFSATGEDNPFTEQNLGTWMCLTNGALCFGHHNNGTVDDGMSWDDRTRIQMSSYAGDSGNYKSIGIKAKHILFDADAFAFYCQPPHYVEPGWVEMRSGIDTVACGNKNLIFAKGVLYDVENNGDAYPTDSFDIDNKRYHFTNGVIDSITNIEQNNNEGE